MKIFLSFASSNRATAERVQLALQGAGHDVFFDEASLPPGSDYNSRIREAINECDRYVFLISPDTFKEGRYIATELKFAKQKWPKPWGFVLPVIISETPLDSIDPYLAAATYLIPKGNVAAEVAAAIKQMPTPPPPDKFATNAWLKRAIQVAAVFVATCFVDSLVPGTASLIIYAPNEIPMRLATLQVEIIPVGLLGEAGGDHTRYDGFDSRGVAQISIKLGMLETLVKCRVYDQSSPSHSVINELVYVSPLVRRGIFTKVVHF